MSDVAELLASIRAHDPYTASHGERVAAYAQAIAQALGLTQSDQQEIHWVALLHDIGKLHVPSAILNKPTALDVGELAQMRRHPQEGATLLADVGLPKLGMLVCQHHERMDGRGYPEAMIGHAIHLHARIVSVADVFDAMTTDRSYQPAVPQRAAEAELRRVAGTQLDADAVEAFILSRARERARRRWPVPEIAERR